MSKKKPAASKPAPEKKEAKAKSKGIKAPSMYDTWDFYEVGDKGNYKVISKADGTHCGWIGKNCVDKDKVLKEKK